MRGSQLNADFTDANLHLPYINLASFLFRFYIFMWIFVESLHDCSCMQNMQRRPFKN